MAGKPFVDTMTSWTKKLFPLLATMGFVGCVATSTNYYYLSLEKTPGAQVVAVSKLNLEKLYGNSKMPTVYQINRADYELKIQVGDGYQPSLQVSVKTNGLFLKPNRDLKVKSESGVICSSYELDKENPIRMTFDWSAECRSDDIPKHISFYVVNRKGEIIAQEKIPFLVKRNGRYRYI
ncbi:hypothetical protein DWB84_11455 [Saccharophagus sp. K07]|jgi:hypothetical protein|uniref:hypothetical protein n=1 Tax=Saccharophagus sp. K07 TaxID=2283636 RepID=UPI001651B78C|nr:hypothetical protein [Saccharophagus sp. K07]MBC6906075.1 hypothetical protein [Saccharophagus sp. K07]